MILTESTAAKPSLRQWLRHPIWAPLNDPVAWQRLTTAINPLWTLGEVRARVIRNVFETQDTRSLWLKPNRHFRGFRPGQHLMLELEIAGVRHARCFSLSAAPRPDGLLRLTIKARKGGRVSMAAHQLEPSQIVRISQASGEFSPKSGTAPLLLISAGSGITPMLSILDGLAAAAVHTDIHLVHGARTPSDWIGADELKRRAEQLPGLKIHFHGSDASGRLQPQDLSALVPDWSERDALLCGPDAFMQAFEAHYAKAGLSARLRSESFGRRAAPLDPAASRHAVTHGKPEQMFTANSGQSLLEAAEAAGLQPRFGCRRGICMSCQCRKHSGTVKNLLTGQLSSPGEELIQLCISTPQSAVELAL
ncbi:MAG: ferredoxin reductase [Lysobacterales bacterium]